MGHKLLLVHGAVVLQGQDHWVVRRLGKQRRKQSLSDDEARPLNGRMIDISSLIHPAARVTQYLTYFEGVLFDGFDDVSENHFGCECVAVVNNRLSISPIPTVQLYTATALHQCSARKENLHENLHTTGIPPALSRNFTCISTKGK